MTFTRTVVTVTEALQRYEADAILRDLMPDDDIEAIGALLRPAFAGETLLRYLPATSDIEMSAYARSLWYFLAEVREGEATPSFANTKQRLLAKYRGVKPPPPPPVERWAEAQPVSVDDAPNAALLATAFDDARAEGGHEIGADGMSVFAFKRDAAGVARFKVWSPRPGSKAHQFVLLLYRLAERNLRTDDAERRLEEIHGYLELGLPWKVVSQSPMVVRVFGSLSSRDLPALCEALARLPLGERVVLDLTRLAGMGTLLHPAWRSWAEDRPSVIWAEGEHIGVHLDAIGVPRERRFPDLATALAHAS